MRCTFAGGTRETRRRTSASAVNVKVTPFFGVYWYRPSSRRRRRDSETGPRAPYLHRRSRPCRSLPCTAVSACSENPAPTATRRRGGDGGSSSPRGRCRASRCAASYSSERPWSLEVREVLLRAPQHPHQDALDLGGVWRGQLHQLARRRPQRLCHQPVKMRRDLKARPEPLREDDRPTSEGARHSQPSGDGPLPPPHRPHQSQLEAFEEFGPLHHQEAQLEGQTQMG